MVLPAISWQGLNPVDDDFDGFADSFPRARSLGLERPFAGGGLPPRFNAEVAPLLRYLERERLAYDLTTDLSLARGEGPALGNAPGVAFAGSALWLPEPLMRRLRDEVADGLRVASFGADALRRTVRVRDGRLTDPRRQRVNAFGEATSLLETSNAPLTVFEDGLGLFEGLDSFIGDFTEFEQSRRLPTAAQADRERRARPERAGLRGLRPRRRPGDPHRHGPVGGAARGVRAERRGAGRNDPDLAPAGAGSRSVARAVGGGS